MFEKIPPCLTIPLAIGSHFSDYTALVKRVQIGARGATHVQSTPGRSYVVRPHTSIARLMLVIAILAFPCGVLGSVLNGRPMFGLDFCLDTGLIPSVTILIGLSPTAVRRGRSQPFIAGFVAAGWLAVMVYIGCCRMFPTTIAAPALYYINEIEPRFMNADTFELYSVSLLARGTIMAVPQVLIALAGGWLASLAARGAETTDA
jgi:hypothetical protein